MSRLVLPRLGIKMECFTAPAPQRDEERAGEHRVSAIRNPWDVLTLNPNAKHNPLSRLVLGEATLTRTLNIHTVQLQWGRDVPEILKAQTILKA